MLQWPAAIIRRNVFFFQGWSRVRAREGGRNSSTPKTCGICIWKPTVSSSRPTTFSFTIGDRRMRSCHQNTCQSWRRLVEKHLDGPSLATCILRVRSRETCNIYVSQTKTRAEVRGSQVKALHHGELVPLPGELTPG